MTADTMNKYRQEGKLRRRFDGKVRSLHTVWWLSALCLLGLQLPISEAAAAEENYLFNATLSLTGDCAVSALDPVADPGCPGGAHPPSGRFVKPSGVAVDPYGSRYVLNYGGNVEGLQSRIDVFSPSGQFLTEVDSPSEPTSVAVDSEGYLYLGRSSPEIANNLLRYKPTKYNPAAGEIEYSTAPVSIPSPVGIWGWPTVAINPANDHLFTTDKNAVREFKSGAEDNGYLEAVVDSSKTHELAEALTIDATRKRILVSDFSGPPGLDTSKPSVGVFELEAPHELLFRIDGSSIPEETFTSDTARLPVAVDETTGHIFVGDLGGAKKAVYEFDENGALVSTIEHSFAGTITRAVQIAVDNSPTSPVHGFLFVGSGVAPGHSYAFEPKPETEPPAVEGLFVTGITDDEAILQGKVDPGGLPVDYHFEYTTQEDFETHGFEGATFGGEGTLKPSTEALSVSSPITGLTPATPYRFRLIAENEKGEAEAQSSFATYSAPDISNGCPNQDVRIGPSATLPDCRAYELVTPANTNGNVIYGQASIGFRFASRLASSDGNAVSFQMEGGVIPGTDGTGSFFGDAYLARRGADGWHTENAGPSGVVAPAIVPGSPSPDQGHSFWEASGTSGPTSVEEKPTGYVRYPDGHSEVLGIGSIGTDPETVGLLISDGGSHIVFATGMGASPTTAVRLEPDAAPNGTRAIYDRTADGVVHVVSLLPGDTPLGKGEDANFVGASLDGEGIAFSVDGVLYLRHHGAETYEIGEGLEFAGIAEGGARVFYVDGGDLFAFDAPTATTTPFTESGDVTVVNVSANGSAAYFISPQALAVGVNPNGDLPQAGAQNLYLSREGTIDFVGTVTDRDVEGREGDTFTRILGLGLWTKALESNGAVAIEPSRTTADGGVLLFESRASLAGYDTEGHAQVYRYDATEDTLRCLSCNPTGTPTGEASLQSLNIGEPLLNYWNYVNNLRPDGKRAFFESTEALVLGDTDGLRDVYEWEDEGVGSCRMPGGCVYLVSSGASSREDYLFAVSDSGDDVFFRTADLLLPVADPDETPSIYDARVGGGFKPPQGPPGECLGEVCQPAVVAPNDPTPASSIFRGVGNVASGTAKSRRCRKGRRVLHRSGGVRCVAKKHVKRRKQSRSNANRRASR